MQARNKISEPSIYPEQRRATKEITDGIEDRINELHLLSAWKRAGEISFFALLYFTGAFIVYHVNDAAGLTLMGILGMGIALNSLGILIHEGLHGLLAKNPRINHFLTFLIGVPILMSATAYKKTHSDHHWNLGRKLDYGTYKQHVKKPFAVWIAYYLQLLFGTIIYAALIPFLAFRVSSRKAQRMIVLEYGAIIIIYSLLFMHLTWGGILYYWCFPLIVMSVLTNIRGLASHALADTENIFLSSRTVKCSRLMSFLFLHENYHLEHHLFPGVPSYNLPLMHSLIWSRLPAAVYARSYRQFLMGFFRAAFRGELAPMGVVHPAELKNT